MVISGILAKLANLLGQLGGSVGYTRAPLPHGSRITYKNSQKRGPLPTCTEILDPLLSQSQCLPLVHQVVGILSGWDIFMYTVEKKLWSDSVRTLDDYPFCWCRLIVFVQKRMHFSQYYSNLCYSVCKLISPVLWTDPVNTR